MTGLKLHHALGVACFFVLCPGMSVAADPMTEVDIRSADGKVLIAADQIRSYEWATHTLSLATPKVRHELAKRLPQDRMVSGIPFTVAVGGKAVYKGTFTTMASSRSFSTPVIVVDAQAVEPKLGTEQLRIQLGYPTAEFYKGDDPRADRRLREALQAGGKLSLGESEHSRWLAKSLREMQTIKPGMTREDLLKVFQEQGGLSSRTTQRYAYRECPYIHVDVVFEAVGAPKGNSITSPKDKIVRISGPFLGWPIID
jgi:hypothetical protein